MSACVECFSNLQEVFECEVRNLDRRIDWAAKCGEDLSKLTKTRDILVKCKTELLGLRAKNDVMSILERPGCDRMWSVGCFKLAICRWTLEATLNSGLHCDEFWQGVLDAVEKVKDHAKSFNFEAAACAPEGPPDPPMPAHAKSLFEEADSWSRGIDLGSLGLRGCDLGLSAPNSYRIGSAEDAVDIISRLQSATQAVRAKSARLDEQAARAAAAKKQEPKRPLIARFFLAVVTALSP